MSMRTALLQLINVLSTYSDTPEELHQVAAALAALGKALNEGDLRHLVDDWETRSPTESFARKLLQHAYDPQPEAVEVVFAEYHSRGYRWSNLAAAIRRFTRDVAGEVPPAQDEVLRDLGAGDDSSPQLETRGESASDFPPPHSGKIII